MSVTRINIARSTAIKQFIVELKADLNDYRSLLELMTIQHKLLTKRETEKLSQISGNHKSFLGYLEARAKNRLQLLIQIGVSADSSGVAKLVAALPNKLARPLESDWNDLHRLIELCKAQNERNNSLLDMQQSILTQLTQDNDPKLYSPE
ncbi:flagellar export chaperone FlgN [Vibrio amylolyticus]|uniref:flagellar export chaperone FlgN n=1 Tax=Vibrio amylolyticus TaxID=2847292 RepID=UPI00354E36F5